jgi:hypothetical protein
VLDYFCRSSVSGLSVVFGDAVSVFNLSASAIRRRILDSMLRLTAGSVAWFISNSFLSSWRATSANSSSGIKWRKQIETPVGQQTEYVETLRGMALRF